MIFHQGTFSLQKVQRYTSHRTFNVHQHRHSPVRGSLFNCIAMKFNKGQAECCAELGLQPRAHRRIVSNNAKQCRKYLQEFLNDIPARQLFDSSDNISDFQARAKSFVSEYGARLWGQAARSRLEPGAPVYPRDKAS